MGESKWYLRTQDETFGPETEARLVEWAKLGRVQPGQEISDDNVIWTRVEEVPFLDMRFSIDIGDGNPRGPFNKAAADALIASGRLPSGAKVVETRPPFPVEAQKEPEPAEEPDPEEDGPVEETAEKTVEKIVEVPVEKIVEKIVEVPVEKIVEKLVEKTVEIPVERIVEKIVVDETRVKELEGLLDEERRHTADLQGRIDEIMRSSSAMKAELTNKNAELKARNDDIAAKERLLAERDAALKDAVDRSAKLSEQVVALEDELKRLPAAASEVADIQAAVFKIMQDEVSVISATLEREKAEFEECRKRHQVREAYLQECRRGILKMSGRDLEDMTRKALLERPEDPRTTRLRRDYEELRRVHEKAMLDSEARIRQLSEQVRESRAEGMRLGESMRDVTQLRAEAEQLREALQRTEKDLMTERQRCEELRQREAVGKQALMARLASLESPSIGTVSSMETNQSREAKMVKLPGWMRLKK